MPIPRQQLEVAAIQRTSRNSGRQRRPVLIIDVLLDGCGGLEVGPDVPCAGLVEAEVGLAASEQVGHVGLVWFPLGDDEW